MSAIHSSKNWDSKKRSSRSVLPVGFGPWTTEVPKFGALARGGDLNGILVHGPLAGLEGTDPRQAVAPGSSVTSTECKVQSLRCASFS